MKNFLAITTLVLGLTMLTTRQMVFKAFEKWGRLYGIDPILLKAVGFVESSFNPFAVSQADCYGVMQILYKTGADGKPTNKFFIDGWPPDSKYQLFLPDYNVGLGAQILKWNIETYGTRKGIAVYNSWSARNETEPFTNQAYLDKVISSYKKFGGQNEI